MPEAPMHKDYSAEAREDKIRTPGNLRNMKPVSQTLSMECPSKRHLGAGILAADARHHSRPRGGIDYIGHTIFPGESSPTWYWTSTMTSRSPR